MKLAVANNHLGYGACERFMSKKVLANSDRIVTAKAVRKCLSGRKIAVTRYSICSNIVHDCWWRFLGLPMRTLITLSNLHATPRLPDHSEIWTFVPQPVSGTKWDFGRRVCRRRDPHD
jgi:hypothetical protein